MMTRQDSKTPATQTPSTQKQGIVTPRLILGLTLIAIGVIYTLERLGYADAEQWIRWWPAILVVAGLGKLLFPGSSAGRWTGLLIAGVGVWLLGEELDLIGESFFDWWPVILILFGIRFVAQGLFGRRRRIESDAHAVNAMAVLGGGARTNTSADFRGGDLMVFMGGYEIDLRQARIQNSPAVIDAFAFWGGLDIRVPDDWTVTVRGIPLLGAFEDNTSVRDEAIPGPEQELVVKGFAIMGGVEIKN